MTQAAAPPNPALLDPVRFAEICEALRRVLQRGVEQRGGAYNRQAGPLLWLVWGRLSRLARRFRRLSEKLAAGTLAPPRPRPSRRRPALPPAAASQPTPPDPAPPAAAPQAPAAPPAPLRLPRHWFWLPRVMQELAVGGNWLRLLLEEPGTAALIQAAPQVGRHIRPLCHMLGVDLPPWLRLPRRPRRQRPQAPPRSAATAPGARPRAAPPAAPSPPAAPPAGPSFFASHRLRWPPRAHGPPDTG